MFWEIACKRNEMSNEEAITIINDHLITFDGGKTSSSPSPSLASMSSPQELRKRQKKMWVNIVYSRGQQRGLHKHMAELSSS